MRNQQVKVDLVFSADTNKAKAQINELAKSLDEISKKPLNATSLQGDSRIASAAKAAEELRVNLQNAVNVDTGKLDLSRFAAGLQKSGKSIQDYRLALGQVGDIGREAFNQLTVAIASAEAPTTRLNKKMKDFMTTMKNTVKWQISSSLMNSFVGAIQSAYGYAQDLNESLNNIRIVTGQSVDQMAEFARQANKAARELSTTTTEYTNASLIFYQQGLSGKEVEERTAVTIKMANAAGESAETASEQLTAVWNNFYEEGGKALEYYADVMTALGAATASSTEEISEGVNKFAATAKTVGLSYEYATAALATVTATTRESADTVGNAFKTLFSRIQGLNLGETLDDGTTLNKYSEALAKVGINIKDSSGELKEMDVILDEMGSKWETLGKAEQVALAETVGGARQYTQLIALMDNWSYFKENLDVAYNSEGALQEQADIYAESWEAARDRVKNAAESIYDSLIDDEGIIKLLNAVEKVLNVVEGLVKGFGGLGGILSTLGSTLLGMYATELPTALNNIKDNINVITGKAQKNAEQLLGEVQEDLNRRIQGPKDNQTDTSSYALELKKDEASIAMKKKLMAVSSSLSQVKQQELEQQRKNIEAAYEEAVAYAKVAEEKKKELKQLEPSFDGDQGVSIIENFDNKKKEYKKAVDKFGADDPRTKKIGEEMDEARIQARDFWNSFDNVIKENEGNEEVVNKLQEIKTLYKQYQAALVNGEEDVAQARLNELNQTLEKQKEDWENLFKTLAKRKSAATNILEYTSEQKNLFNNGKADENEIRNNLKNYFEQQTEDLFSNDEDKENNPFYQYLQSKISQLTDNETPLSNILKHLWDKEIIDEEKDQGDNFLDSYSASGSEYEEKAIAAAAITVRAQLGDTAPIEAYRAKVEELTASEEARDAIMEKIKASLNGFGDKEVEVSEVIGQSAGAMLSLVNVFNSGKSAIETWTDDTADLSTKMSATIPVLFQLISAGKQLKGLASLAGGWAAAAVTAIAAIAAVVSYAVNNPNLLEAQIEKATTATENAKTVAEETKNAYQSLLNSIEQQKNGLEALTQLDEKTQEWRDKVRELNADFLTLLNTYQTLSGFEIVTDENGVWQFKDPDAVKNVLLEEERMGYIDAGTAIESEGKLKYDSATGAGITSTDWLLQEIVNSKYDYSDDVLTLTGGKTLSDINKMPLGELAEWILGLDEDNPIRQQLGSSAEASKNGNEFGQQALSTIDWSRIFDYVASGSGDYQSSMQEADMYNQLALLTGEAYSSVGVLPQGVLFDNFFKSRLQELEGNNIVSSVEDMTQQVGKSYIPNFDNWDEENNEVVLTTGEKISWDTAKDQINSNARKSQAVQDTEDYAEQLNQYFEQIQEEYGSTMVKFLQEGASALTRDERDELQAIIGEITEDTWPIFFASLFNGFFDEGLQNLWQSEYSAIESLPISLDSEYSKIQTDKKVVSDLFYGDTIEAEDYNTLTKTSKEYFTLLEDGTYRLVGDAEELNKILSENELENLAEQAKLAQESGSDEEYQQAINSMVANVTDKDSYIAMLNEVSEKGLELSEEQQKMAVAQMQEGEGLLHGLSNDEVEEQAETIMSLAENVDYLADELADNEEAAEEAAREMLRYRKGVEKVSSSYDDWLELLEQGGDALINDLDAVKELRDAYADLLDVDASSLSDDFVKSAENLELLKEAAEGSSDAYNDLQENLAINLAGDAAADLEDIIHNLTHLEGYSVGEQIDGSALDWLMVYFATISATAGDTVGDVQSAVDSIIEAANAIGTNINTVDWEQKTIYYNARTPNEIIPEALDSILYGNEDGSSASGVGWSTEPGDEYTESFTMMVPKGKLNVTKSAENLGGGSSKSSSSGGGGGSSKKDKKKYGDEIERYHEINEVLEDLQSQLDAIAEAKDRAFGQDKLDLLDQEIAKQKELVDAQKQYLSEIESYLPSDKSALAAYGAVFDEAGRIINYDEIMKAQIDKFNRSLTDDAEEAYNEFKEILDQYEETLNLYEEQEQELINLRYELLDKQLEVIQTEIEMRTDLADDSIDMIEYLIKKLEDSAFTAAERIALLGDQVAQLENKVSAEMEGIERIFADSGLTTEQIADVLFGQVSYEDMAKYDFSQDQIDAIREYRDNILDVNEELLELRKTVVEEVVNAFEEWSDEMDTHIDKFDHYNDVLESYKSIIELIGKDMLGIADSLTKSIGETTLNNAVNKLAAAKDKMDALRQSEKEAQEELDAARARGNETDTQLWEDTLEEINEKTREAESDMLDAWEEGLEAAGELFEESVEAAIEAYEKALSGTFGSLDALQEAFDQASEVSERYVDDYRKIYELSKLNRDIVNSMDETDNIRAKKVLRELQEEINELQESDTEMSEYDLDYLRKKYELRLAEIALEEAQNAKSQVRMSRDSEGNWSYIYTADQDAVEEAYQNYEDKLYEMQKLNSEYIKEVQDGILQSEIELANALRELDKAKFASDEEYYAEVSRITEYYTGMNSYYLSEEEKAIKNNQETYQKDWTEYSKVTGYKISADEDYVDSFDETIYSQITGYQTIQEAQEAFAQATQIMVNDLKNAFASWSESVSRLMKAADTTISQFSGDVAESIYGDGEEPGLIEASNDAADSVNNMAESMVTDFSKVTDAVTSWQETYSDNMDKIIAKNEEVVKSANAIITAQSGYDANGEKLPVGSDTEDNSGAEEGEETGTQDNRANSPTGYLPSEYSKNQSSSYYTKNATKAIQWALNELGFGNSGTNSVDGVFGSGTKKAVKAFQSAMGLTSDGIVGTLTRKAFATKGYKTGGLADYTGPAWLDGTPARPELVLNSSDTSNLLSAVEMIRNIAKSIDLNAVAQSFGLGTLQAATAGAANQVIEQHVEITASFPNATDHNEIEMAFENLTNVASQYANRKK